MMFKKEENNVINNYFKRLCMYKSFVLFNTKIVNLEGACKAI